MLFIDGAVAGKQHDVLSRGKLPGGHHEAQVEAVTLFCSSTMQDARGQLLSVRFAAALPNGASGPRDPVRSVGLHLGLRHKRGRGSESHSCCSFQLFHEAAGPSSKLERPEECAPPCSLAKHAGA